MSVDGQKLDQLVERAVNDLSAGYGGVMISMGQKLGLFRGMAGAGPLSSHELASRVDCNERYVREWLNAQVAGRYVNFNPSSQTYELTEEQAMVLANENSPVFIPPAWQVVSSMWFDEEKALNAFKTGKGISWGDHDERLYCGVAAFYRNSYRASLVSEWLPALSMGIEKLEAGIHVGDVGCGHGHSTVLMAEAFPDSRFWGFDIHDDSIHAARELAREAGVTDRVTFEVADATSYPNEKFGLLCFFDCLHDMGRPRDAAVHAGETLADDGTVMLVEPFAADHVEDNINNIGRLYYAASTTLCCAHAISENGTHVLGAQAGEKQLREIFISAGFRNFRRAVETPFNLVLEAQR